MFDIVQDWFRAGNSSTEMRTFSVARLACLSVLLGAPLLAPAFGCGKQAKNAALERESQTTERIRKSMADREKEIAVEVSGTKIEFCYIPAGQFTMGSPATEEGHHASEEPARIVKITKPFYLGKYEVTQAQYEAIMGVHESAFRGDNLPCDQLQPTDALNYCTKLSETSGVEVSLPTEAQWEYACRAGSQTRFCAGDTEEDLKKVAWYRENSGKRTHPVGEKEPNAFGLYDMHANISEICLDSLTERGYTGLPDVDPIGPQEFFRALRGGGWHSGAAQCRSAARFTTNPRLGLAGMRLIINLSDEK